MPGNNRRWSQVTMDEQIIGILPFISFSEEIIKIDEFLIFSDANISDIDELGESLRGRLNAIAENQKSFMKSNYGNQELKITFITSTNFNVTQENLEKLIEIIFFFLHKGGKLTQLLSTPNVYCKEDFKLFVLRILDSEKTGQFLEKKKFKFHISYDVNEYIILPSGCENAISQNQQYGFVFKDVNFDYQSDIFGYLYQVFCENKKQHILQAILFYNKAVSCNQTDPERFVLISSSLEAFFEIGQQNDKKKAIKQKVENLLQTKTFQVVEKNDAVKHITDLVSLVYDYRSSYIHSGKLFTDNTSIESSLTLSLGKLDFMIGIMNFVSVLLLEEIIPDNRIEGVLHLIFYNQKCFEQVIRIFKDSADHAKSKLNRVEHVIAIHRLLIADFQTIVFDKSVVERCLNNILRLLAKYARENKHQPFATEIQKQIDEIDFNNDDKFQKWNEFLKAIDISPIIPEYVFNSIMAFKQLFQLIEYEFTLY